MAARGRSNNPITLLHSVTRQEKMLPRSKGFEIRAGSLITGRDGFRCKAIRFELDFRKPAMLREPC